MQLYDKYHDPLLQMIIKWLMFSTIPGDVFGFFYPGSHCAPSLLIGLINMCMLKPRMEGFWNRSSSTELKHCYLQEWYPSQVMKLLQSDK